MTDIRGLYSKFRVARVDGGRGKHVGCEYFVLDLTHDPHAMAAIAAYAEAVVADRPNLAADLRARHGGQR